MTPGEAGDATSGVSLDGWDIVSADEAEWMPWTGSAGEARDFATDTGATYVVIFKL